MLQPGYITYTLLQENEYGSPDTQSGTHVVCRQGHVDEMNMLIEEHSHKDFVHEAIMLVTKMFFIGFIYRDENCIQELARIKRAHDSGAFGHVNYEFRSQLQSTGELITTGSYNVN